MLRGIRPRRRQLARRLAEARRDKWEHEPEGSGTIHLSLLTPLHFSLETITVLLRVPTGDKRNCGRP